MTKPTPKVYMIDNYDSFTYNLVQYLGELGAEVIVERNDQTSIAAIEAAQPTHLMVSPGPCTPNEAGLSMEAIKHFAGKLPILGVCLGHQSIGQVFGGDVVHAKTVMHGKISAIEHSGTGVFTNLPSPLQVTRYHSLVVAEPTLPEDFEITAWTMNDDGGVDEIMGMRHKTLAVEGVQFHPESIMTDSGHAMLKNFLEGK